MNSFYLLLSLSLLTFVNCNYDPTFAKDAFHFVKVGFCEIDDISDW